VLWQRQPPFPLRQGFRVTARNRISTHHWFARRQRAELPPPSRCRASCYLGRGVVTASTLGMDAMHDPERCFDGSDGATVFVLRSAHILPRRSTFTPKDSSVGECCPRHCGVFRCAVTADRPQTVASCSALPLPRRRGPRSTVASAA